MNIEIIYNNWYNFYVNFLPCKPHQIHNLLASENLQKSKSKVAIKRIVITKW